MSRIRLVVSSLALAAALALGSSAFVPVSYAGCTGTNGGTGCRQAPAPDPRGCGTNGGTGCRAEAPPASPADLIAGLVLALRSLSAFA